MLRAIDRGRARLQQWQTVPVILKNVFESDREVEMLVRADDPENVSKAGADVSDWPSLEELGKALREQMNAHAVVRRAFEQVPASRHIGVERPDSFDLPSPPA